MQLEIGDMVRIKVGGCWRPCAGQTGQLIFVSQEPYGCTVYFDHGNLTLSYSLEELEHTQASVKAGAGN